MCVACSNVIPLMLSPPCPTVGRGLLVELGNGYGIPTTDMWFGVFKLREERVAHDTVLSFPLPLPLPLPQSEGGCGRFRSAAIGNYLRRARSRLDGFGILMVWLKYKVLPRPPKSSQSSIDQELQHAVIAVLSELIKQNGNNL